jgi:DUF2075 family protein
MLLTVAQFRDAVQQDMSSLVRDLRALTGRYGEEEANAWRNSLPKLATLLSSRSLDGVHVHLAKREHHLSLEYKLPGASSWCDVVLLGEHQGRASAVVVELKDWDTSRDRPGVAPGLIERRGAQELHPSDQVCGYVRYCQRFHSAVLDANAEVHGCVLLTRSYDTSALRSEPNAALVTQFPLFTTSANDSSVAFPAYLADRLTSSSSAFAQSFESGTYQQDRSFLAQIGAEILSGDSSAFELLDNQRRAFHLCTAKVGELLKAQESQRKCVLIVEGPPGSGKSAVAARLWSHLVSDKSTRDGNVVLVTTSQSQSSNWTHLIDRTTGTRIGAGVARKATSFTPINTPRLGQLRRAFGNDELFKDASSWRLNMQELRGLAPSVRFQGGSEDDSCLVTLVDEAHALINPEREHGVGQYGFVTGLGPQAWHIIRCSEVTVFFIDPAQGFRARENTSIQDLRDWSAELGATVHEISLAGSQFRCAGSAEYVAWVESLLDGNAAAVNAVHADAWRQHDVLLGAPGLAPEQFTVQRSAANDESTLLVAAEPQPEYAKRGARLQGRRVLDIRVFDSPFDLEQALRQTDGSSSMRLLSSYSRPWKTTDSTSPHDLPPEALDFNELVPCDPLGRRWSKPWNVVQGQDYTSFIQGRPGSVIASDPLAEVGCPYAVRGFDYQYVGLIWLDDLVWRQDRWVVQVENVHESGIKLITRRAAKEGTNAPAGPNGEILLSKVVQAYRILLTRAIKGVFVWIADEETREHVRRSLHLGQVA